MRIVSLVPSATEILFTVGAGDDVVGVTHECDYPTEARRRTHVTSDRLPPGLSPAEIDAAVSKGVAEAHTIYRLDQDALARLAPDLVVTQSLCAVCAVPTDQVVEAVCAMPARARLVATDPQRLDDVIADVARIGQAAHRSEEADAAVEQLHERLRSVDRAVDGRPRPRVLVLEWPDPPFLPGHWVPEQVARAGGRNVAGAVGAKSTRTSWQHLDQLDADFVLLAFCGFDLAATLDLLPPLWPRPEWRRLLRRARVVAVDGSAYFSRPGPRLVDGVELLASLLHPDSVQSPHPFAPVVEQVAGPG